MRALMLTALVALATPLTAETEQSVDVVTVYATLHHGAERSDFLLVVGVDDPEFVELPGYGGVALQVLELMEDAVLLQLWIRDERRIVSEPTVLAAFGESNWVELPGAQVDTALELMPYPGIPLTPDA